MNQWLILITSLPTVNATSRMRVWRALKTLGTHALRDGVYLLPNLQGCSDKLHVIAQEVNASGGHAQVLDVVPPDDTDFITLFDRTQDYSELLSEITMSVGELNVDTVNEVSKTARKHRKALGALADIDFFPSEAQLQVQAALADLEKRVMLLMSPDEPQMLEGVIPLLKLSDYQGRTWATRNRPWVDRLASAWLIRTHVDRKARIAWIASPQACPKSALGFDFEGAAFTHVGAKVTFEVLVASFGLETPALTRLGAMVHCLDVGGIPSPEATGVEAVLKGLQSMIESDDKLLDAACVIFDGLLKAFETEGLRHEHN